MRKILLLLLAAMSLIGEARPQEMVGEKAETVKMEIVKLYDEKLGSLLAGGSVAADYFERYDADDIMQTNADGSTPTKAKVVAGLRSGAAPKLLTMTQDEHRVHVYANGNTVVVTDRGIGTNEFKGKVSTIRNRFTDVWVRQNGEWRRVAHMVTAFATQ